MPHKPQPILIASCGNAMAGDDALGPWVTQRLRQHPPAWTEIVDLDLNPAGLLDHLPRDQAVFIIDAIKIEDQDAGQIVDINWFSPDRPKMVHDDVLSSHGLSIASQINLAQTLDLLPPIVRLIGVTLNEAKVGDDVSEKVAAKIDLVVKTINDQIERIINKPLEVNHA